MPSNLEPGSLLRRMFDAYANCSTYRDHGQVVTKIVSARTPPVTQRKPFATHFVRPDRFRFEFRSKVGQSDDFNSRYVIWRVGSVCETYWDIDNNNDCKSLGEALGAAAGVSSGSSLTVPDLLMPGEIRPSPIRAIHSAAVTPDDSLGMSCLAIRGTTKTGESTFYLDPSTLLVRGIREARDYTVAFLDEQNRQAEEALREYAKQFPDRAAERNFDFPKRKPFPFSSETLTTYTPEVNVDIDPQTFSSPLDERWLPETR